MPLSKYSRYYPLFMPGFWIDPNRKCQNPSALSMRHNEVLDALIEETVVAALLASSVFVGNVEIEKL